MFVGTNRLEAAPPAAKPVFKAGFAARDITPEIGLAAGRCCPRDSENRH
jgi:hypothetical protein